MIMDSADVETMTPVDLRIADPAMAWELATMEARYRVAVEQVDDRSSQIRELRQEVYREQNRMEAFKQDLVERFLERAEEKSLCSEAEEFLEELGLSEYMENDVDVEIQFTVSVRRKGRQRPDEQDIEEAAIDFVRNSLSEYHCTIDD